MGKTISSDMILSKIHYIRGHKVMLDKDLAELYEVETRVLNQAVIRNIASFPDDFMFQLTRDEFKILMSQIVISRYRPRSDRHGINPVPIRAGAIILSITIQKYFHVPSIPFVIMIFPRGRTL